LCQQEQRAKMRRDNEKNRKFAIWRWLVSRQDNSEKNQSYYS
jgi:hypothetical protein